MADTIPKLLTLAEVSEALRVSPHTVRSWVRKGRLSPVRLCRRLLFRTSDLEQLIQSAHR